MKILNFAASNMQNAAAFLFKLLAKSKIKKYIKLDMTATMHSTELLIFQTLPTSVHRTTVNAVKSTVI